MRHGLGRFDVVGRSSGWIAGKVSLRFTMLKYFITAALEMTAFSSNRGMSLDTPKNAE